MIGQFINRNVHVVTNYEFIVTITKDERAYQR